MISNKSSKRDWKLTLESRGFWIALIAICLLVPILFFVQNRYVGGSQEVGPVDTSSYGGSSPFQVILKLSCQSMDGSYLSDSVNITCQILVQSKTQNIDEMEFGVLIRNMTGQTVVICNGTAQNIETSGWVSAALDTSSGSSFFELPAGDYKVLVQQFSVMGGGVIVTKAKPMEFRGVIHVISDFEKKTRLSQDGVSLATFFAFLFLIPTTLIEIRSFLFKNGRT